MRLARLISGYGHGWTVQIGDEHTSALLVVLRGRPQTLTSDDWSPEKLHRRDELLHQGDGDWDYYAEVPYLGPDQDGRAAFYAPSPQAQPLIDSPDPQAATVVVENFIAALGRFDQGNPISDLELWSNLRHRLATVGAELPDHVEIVAKQQGADVTASVDFFVFENRVEVWDLGIKVGVLGRGNLAKGLSSPSAFLPLSTDGVEIGPDGARGVYICLTKTRPNRWLIPDPEVRRLLMAI